MRPDLAAAILLLAMFTIALMIHGCAAPPAARELCAAAPVDRKLWDKACEGMHQPRRPPENLCNDPDGRALWPFDYAVRCKEK